MREVMLVDIIKLPLIVERVVIEVVVVERVVVLVVELFAIGLLTMARSSIEELRDVLPIAIELSES